MMRRYKAKIGRQMKKVQVKMKRLKKKMERCAIMDVGFPVEHLAHFVTRVSLVARENEMRAGLAGFLSDSRVAPVGS